MGGHRSDDSLTGPAPTGRARVAPGLGRAASRVSRIAGRGEGSVIGGEVALRVDPTIARRLAAPMRVALVSGTNGKTTTTTLLAAGLATVGTVATNRTGANLANGLTGALLTEPDADLRRPRGRRSRTSPGPSASCAPAAVALLNLSRDQLDRLNEVRGTAERWRTALAAAPPGLVVANADDPLVVWAVGDPPGLDDRVGGCRAGLAARRLGLPVVRGRPPLRAPTLVAAPAADGPDPTPTTRSSTGRWSSRTARTSTSDLALPGRSAMANATMAFAVIDRIGLPTDGGARRVAPDPEHRGPLPARRPTKAPSSCCTWPRTRPAGATCSTSWPSGDRSAGAGAQRAGPGRPGSVVDLGRPLRAAPRPAGRVPRRAGPRSGRTGSTTPGSPSSRVPHPDRGGPPAGPGPVDLIANYSAFQQVRAELERATR